MRLLYLILMATLIWTYWCALNRAKNRWGAFTPVMGWLVGLGYFLITPLSILVLHGGYQIPLFYLANDRYASVEFSDSHYLIPFLVLWLATFLAFQSVLLFPASKVVNESTGSPELNEQRLKRVVLLTLGLSVLDCAVSIWRAGGLQQFLISHWYLRQENAFAQFGDLFGLYAQASLANQVVFTAAAALFTSMSLQFRKRNVKFFLLIVAGLLLQMVLSGNRIFVALYGFSFLVACWTHHRRRLLGGLLALSPVILLVFSAWGFLRHNLSTIATDIPRFVEQDFDSRMMSTLMDTTEGSSIMQLLHMVNDFGSKYEFFHGETYTKAITFIVPRSMYPEKPESYPTQIARLYEPGEVTSLGTTQMGELYANFGMFAIWLLPLVTVGMILLSMMLTPKMQKHALFSTVVFLLSISFARSSFEDNFITFLFAVLIIRILRLEKGLCAWQGMPNFMLH